MAGMFHSFTWLKLKKEKISQIEDQLIKDGSSNPYILQKIMSNLPLKGLIVSILIKYLEGRWKSMTYACQGLWHLIKTETQFIFHFAMGVLTCLLGWYYNISISEWLIQTLVIAAVLSAEALNTAIEKLSDLVEPKYSKTIGQVKDMGAAAVFIGVIAAVVIAALIYIPKIFNS